MLWRMKNNFQFIKMVDMDFKINLPFDVTFCRISRYHFLIIPSTKNTHTRSLCASIFLSTFLGINYYRSRPVSRLIIAEELPVWLARRRIQFRGEDRGRTRCKSLNERAVSPSRFCHSSSSLKMSLIKWAGSTERNTCARVSHPHAWPVLDARVRVNALWRG